MGQTASDHFQYLPKNLLSGTKYYNSLALEFFKTSINEICLQPFYFYPKTT